MASLLDMAQARLQGLLDIPTRATRALVNPTLFSGLLGAPTLPQQQGFAESFAQLPQQPNMSVLDPVQAAYMQGYSVGEPYGLLAALAPFTKGMPVGASIKDVSKDMKEAMKIAQKNAALPIEKGGLGLSKDNTAMDRAKAMGFDLPVYHGTKEGDIANFDPSKGIGVSGTIEGQVRKTSDLPFTWGSTNPEIAESYSFVSNARGKALDDYMKSINFDEIYNFGTAKERKEVQNLYKQWKKDHPDYNPASDSATIYPLLVRSENPKIVDAKYETYSFNSKIKPNELAGKAFSGRKKTGEHDLLMIENFNDPPVTGWGGGFGTHVAIKDPSQIRSRFAAFDPMLRKSSNIMSGFIPFGLLGNEEE
jgi:hypothetical protein